MTGESIMKITVIPEYTHTHSWETVSADKAEINISQG